MTDRALAAGPAEPPVPAGTIGDWLTRAVRLHGGTEALVIPYQAIRWTWAELAAKVDEVAAGFDRLGLRIGDRVGICAPNCAEWVLTQLATAQLGIVLVPINPAYRTHELGHALRLSGVRALVTVGRFRESDYTRMLGELVPAVMAPVPGPIFDHSMPELRYVIEIGGPASPARIAFDALQTHAPAPRPQLDAGQAINIQFTSGTTGLPKGATLSHANLLHNAVCATAGMQLGADDRLCIPVPLYHCFGMVLGVLACVVTGATMVFPAAVFEAGAVLDCVSKERCTALHGVPTMFLAMLDHACFDTFDLSGLRTGIVSGAPCPPAMMHRMIDRMNLRDITIGYGMTETSPLSTQTRPGANIESRTQTVGQMLPHCEGRVIDANGAVVPIGKPGEYCSRGPGVMLGYWNQPEATAAAIRDGWMHSGDLAIIDDKCRIRIVGRIKDMIIRGGENIYPAEIEAFLLGHPDIADVAVFGIPDERLGERVCAWVRTHRPVAPDQIITWCEGRIARHKTPAIVRVVDQLPMTVTGNVQKFVMRDAETQ